MNSNVTWAEANRLAVFRAAKLMRRHDFQDSGVVDLVALATAEGILVHFAELPRLAGAYMAETSTRPAGILINNRHSWAKQRYTLGHELGHHCFGHGTMHDADTELIAGGATRSTATEGSEKMAECFAPWVLMPRDLVERRVSELKASTFTSETVYDLSLMLGASYSATCLHLKDLALIAGNELRSLQTVKPKDIKRAKLGEDFTALNAVSDVHTYGSIGIEMHVRPGDLIIPPHDVTELPEQVRRLATSAGQMTRLLVLNDGVRNPSNATQVVNLPLVTGAVKVNIHYKMRGAPECWFE